MAEPNWFRYLKWRRRVAKARREVLSRKGQGMPHGLAGRLIVSLTSYPPRFGSLEITLRSILTQSVAPDEVILWLEPGHEEQLPPAIRALPGLSIRSHEFLRSYMKIIPTLLAYPEATIVTFDDDVYYPRDWLERLVEAAKASPRQIMVHRAHRFTVRDGQPLPYGAWQKNISETESAADVFLTGVHGVLYPPHSLYKDVTRKELFMTLAPMADDVWLYWMARMQGTLIRHVGGRTRIIEWPGSQEVSLKSFNINEETRGNDQAIAGMMGHYGLPEPRS
ncbi:glycosyltransferase family 2 protein [Thioclava sp. GXIMD4215]|uniref:glycosyltransferase family 2 protein n=1 Tax=Thioclava sp. GXIMD4215 TaxID=3131928 RepID=UPI0032458695